MSNNKFVINITESAAKKIKSASRTYKNNDDMPVFRIGLINAGCGGMAYKYEVDHKSTATVSDEETSYTDKGVQLVVKNEFIGILNGCTLDYVDELIGSSFEITNPNAKAYCQCGKSFNMRAKKIKKTEDCIVE